MSETNTNPEARDVIADWLVDHDVNPPRGKSINDLAGTIIAALAAEGKVIEDDWRPIDSAPKDGTVILVNGGLAHWYRGEWRSLTAQDYPGRTIEWPVDQWRPLPTPTLPPAGDDT